jgi:hypothetical protein
MRLPDAPGSTWMPTELEIDVLQAMWARCPDGERRVSRWRRRTHSLYVPLRTVIVSPAREAEIARAMLR